MIDLSNEELLWWSKEPYIIFENKNKKVLYKKFIFKKDLKLNGTVDVKLKRNNSIIILTDVIAETISNHTVISKYI